MKDKTVKSFSSLLKRKEKPVSQKEINKAMREINNRPRKRLNYLTPYQVLVKEMNPKDYRVLN